MKALYATLLVVILDQASKLYIKGFAIPFLKFNHEGMSHGHSVSVIGDFFHITFVENPGMAFGIEINPTTKLLVSIFSIVASIGLFYYLYTVRNQSLSLRLSLALILGGAIGNLIDRVFYGIFFEYGKLFYGRVVDFLDFDFFNLTVFGRTYERFPIFNVADSAVTVGVLLMLIFYKKHQQESDAELAAEQAINAPTIQTDAAVVPDIETVETPVLSNHISDSLPVESTEPGIVIPAEHKNESGKPE